MRSEVALGRREKATSGRGRRVDVAAPAEGGCAGGDEETRPPTEKMTSPWLAFYRIRRRRAGTWERKASSR
jgi:hypothetical protein